MDAVGQVLAKAVTATPSIARVTSKGSALIEEG
jgi:hypothetical protein